jgi:hypothetical protein
VEELRDKSDSESFDDEKEKLLNVEKALELGRVKENLKNLKMDMQGKEDEFESNVKRMESSLEFSRAANRNLKSDYDIMTDKFDKQSKAQNNLNQDLKDEITELNNKVSKL